MPCGRQRWCCLLLLMAWTWSRSNCGFSSVAQPRHWAWQWWESMGSPKWVCSPMIDQSERAFRLLCRRYGVHLAYTPMLHAEPFAVDESYRKTYFDAWTPVDGEEDRPLIAQVGGDDPKTMLQAAHHLEPYVDAIDVNFGCPTEDARKGGHQTHSPRCRRYGAYLLRDTARVTRIVGTLASGLRKVPVTAKIRLLPERRASIDLALAIEESGAAALCVHGRTLAQRPKYAEKHGVESLAPDWDAIAEIAKVVKIPVIANGGIESRTDALRCLSQTGCAAVMSAEALLEKPDLFVEDEEPAIPRMLRLSREFLDLAERHPSPLKYPPTKSHLFKILHRLIGVDQAVARRKAAAGEPLTERETLKLALMCCPVSDFHAIRNALDHMEEKAADHLLGTSWYRRWRPEEKGRDGNNGKNKSNCTLPEFSPHCQTRIRFFRNDLVDYCIPIQASAARRLLVPMGCGRAQCKRSFRLTPLFCRCGLEFCSEACFVSAWHNEHQLSCPFAAQIKEGLKASSERSGTGQLVALALSKTRPEVIDKSLPVEVATVNGTATPPTAPAAKANSSGSSRPGTSARGNMMLAQIDRWRRESAESFETVGDPIGNGSYGFVSKVRFKKTGEIFAMKSIPKDKIREQHMQGYLRREVQTQMQLAHPCIVQLHYYFEDQHNVLLLLEYANGGALFSYVRSRGHLPEPEAARYFANVALALAHLHRYHIVHRDLKPENILLCGDSPKKAKLADFGWCAELSESQERLTFCGTFDYLSPEMLENEPHDKGVDLWAAGVLVFEMLTGRPPFQASSQVKLVNRIVKVDFQVPSSMPPLAADLVKSLLKRNPSERLDLKEAITHPWICLHVPGTSLELSQSCSEISALKQVEPLRSRHDMQEAKVKELEMDSPPRRKEPAPAAGGQTEASENPNTISPASTVSVPQPRAGYSDARSQDSSVSPASTVQVTSRPKPSVMPWSEGKTPTDRGSKDDSSSCTPTPKEAVSNLDFGLDGKDSRAGSKDSNSAPDSSLKWHETETFAKLREWVKTGPVAKAAELNNQLDLTLGQVSPAKSVRRW
eukprot:s1777_g4.t1